MNGKLIFLASLLAAGLLMAGCAGDPPMTLGYATGAYDDPKIAAEWDDDAPNWWQPGDYDKPMAQAPAEPAAEPIFFYIEDDGLYDEGLDGDTPKLGSPYEDEWDEDAPNWRHADEI